MSRHGFVRTVACAIVVLLALGACGGGGSDEPQGSTTITTDESPDDGTQPGDGGTTTTGVERVVCHVPEPTPMSVDQPVNGEVLGFDQCFTFELPEGVVTLTVGLTGLEDELNVTMGYDDPETILFRTGDFWSSSNPGTADESITIDQPAGGTYYVNVAVGGFGSESPFTLLVSTS